MSLKTHKGARKRFRLTKKGKIKRKREGLRHLLTVGKSKKRKRKLRKGAYVGPAEYHKIRKLLPFG